MDPAGSAYDFHIFQPKFPRSKKGMALVTPEYTYKLCTPMITLPMGLFYYLQQSKLLEVELLEVELLEVEVTGFS